MYTLPVALATFATGQFQADHGMLMAGSVVLVVPVLVDLRAAPALDHRGHRHDRPEGLIRPEPVHATTGGRRMPAPTRRPAPAPSLAAAIARRDPAAARRRRRPDLSTSAAGDAARATPSDTWASFVAMTDPRHGPAGRQPRGRRDGSVQTSTTNIGAYMWSTVVAEALGIIDHDEAVDAA